MDYDTLIKQTNDEYDRQKKTYEDEKANQQAALKSSYDTQVSNLGKTRDAALREAYINREIQKRDMPSLLSMQGLRGGATETALSSLLKSYQNARNTAYDTYAQNKTAADNSYNTNLANLGSSYADKFATVEANRSSALMQLYQQKAAQEQAERELALQKELAAQAAASYGGGGGGSNEETVPLVNPTDEKKPWQYFYSTENKPTPSWKRNIQEKNRITSMFGY